MNLDNTDKLRLQDAIALTLEIGEALKRAIYYTETEETLGHLAEIVAHTVSLRKLLISWQSGDEADYQSLRQSDMVDKVDDLLLVLEGAWRELAEIKAMLASREMRE